MLYCRERGKQHNSSLYSCRALLNDWECHFLQLLYSLLEHCIIVEMQFESRSGRPSIPEITSEWMRTICVAHIDVFKFCTHMKRSRFSSLHTTHTLTLAVLPLSLLLSLFILNQKEIRRAFGCSSIRCITCKTMSRSSSSPFHTGSDPALWPPLLPTWWCKMNAAQFFFAEQWGIITCNILTCNRLCRRESQRSATASNQPAPLYMSHLWFHNTSITLALAIQTALLGFGEKWHEGWMFELAAPLDDKYVGFVFMTQFGLTWWKGSSAATAVFLFYLVNVFFVSLWLVPAVFFLAPVSIFSLACYSYCGMVPVHCRVRMAWTWLWAEDCE